MHTCERGKPERSSQSRLRTGRPIDWRRERYSAASDWKARDKRVGIVGGEVSEQTLHVQDASCDACSQFTNELIEDWNRQRFVERFKVI